MNNIASERKRMRLTQADLADELHTTRAVIRDLESGRTLMKCKMLEQMADFFGCSTDYLLGRCDDRLSHLRMPRLQSVDTSYFVVSIPSESGEVDEG